MESGTVVTIGLVVFSCGLIFAGWRAARWLQTYADKLTAAIRSDISAVKDEFSNSHKLLNAALEAAKSDFEKTVKDMGEAHQAFREKTLEEFRLLERDVAGFKLTVAQQYASKGDMQQSVQIILARIDGLQTAINAQKDS